MVSARGNFEEVGVRAVVEGVGQYAAAANQVTASTERINKATTAAAGSTEQYGRSLNALGSRMRESGTQAVLLGTALAAPGIAAVKLALNFDTAITRISTLSGVAEADLAAMREGIDRISAVSGRGPQELATALLAITSTGLRGAQALDVLESSAKASALGLGDAETVGRLLTGTLKAYEKQGLTAARATDILFATVREGGAEADSVAGSLGRVTGIAATFGVTLEEVGAFIATFTRLGIGADEAVTALRGTISSIFAPAEETKKALEEVNLSTEQLQKIVRERGLVAALEVLVQRFGDNSEAISNVIPNVRALAGVLGTAGSQAEGYQQVLDSLKNSQDDFNKAFAQLQETPGFKVQQSIADLQRALIDLGEGGLPVLVGLVSAISDVINVFVGLPDPVQNAILAFGILGGSLLAIGGTASFLIGTLLSLTSTVTTLAGALGLAGAATAAGPIGLGLLATAVVAAGVGYVFLKGKIDEANRAQEESNRLAEASALAQKGTVDQISTRVTELQALIAAEQQQITALDSINNKTAEQRVREQELNQSVQAHTQELFTLAQASDIATTARDLSVKEIENEIKKLEDDNAAREHSIRVLDEEQKAMQLGALTSAQQAQATDTHKASVEELTRGIEANNTTLGRLKAALDIAKQAEANLAAQNKALGTTTDGASAGIDQLANAARQSIKDLSNLTVEAAAASAAIEILSQFQAIGQTNAGSLGGLLSVTKAISNIQTIISSTVEKVKQAEQIKDFIRGLTEQIGTLSGVQTKAQEQAAKAGASAAESAGRAADDAAAEAQRAAEEAQRAMEDLADQAARTAEEASQNAARIAEEAAQAAVRAAEDAAAAYDRIIRQEIESLDQLGGLLVTALRRQAQQALNATLANIKAQRDAQTAASKSAVATIEAQRDAAIRAAEQTRDAEIAAINASRDARIAALNAAADARIAALERELGVIDQQRVAEERADLQRRLALAFEPEDRAAVLKEITEFERRQREQALRDQIDQIKDATRKEADLIGQQADAAVDAANASADAKIDAAKRSADAAIAQQQRELDAAMASLDAQEQAARDTYAALTDEWTLQSQARVLVMQGEIDKIGALLDAFVPEWRAAGLSFGEAIKQGLRASNVAEFIKQTLAGVPNPDTGVTPAELDRQAQIAGLEEMGRKLIAGGAPQAAIDEIAKQIIALGGVPQFNSPAQQATSREEEIRQRQQQGKDLKAQGAPEVILEELRRSLIELGAVPEFRRGLEMGMVRRPMLASLDAGEVVLNRDQQGWGRNITFQAGAFSGMFSGATFSGTPRDNANAIRQEFEAFFQDLGRGAHLAGFG